MQSLFQIKNKKNPNEFLHFCLAGFFNSPPQVVISFKLCFLLPYFNDSDLTALTDELLAPPFSASPHASTRICNNKLGAKKHQACGRRSSALLRGVGS
jgi:hypothetical protein